MRFFAWVALAGCLASTSACQSTVVVMSGAGGGPASQTSPSSGAITGSASSGATTGSASGSATTGGMCEPGTPPDPCEVAPLNSACDWTCAPSAKCVVAGVVCATCPDKAIKVFGIYRCGCDAEGRYACAILPGCCKGDPRDPYECGDAIEMECAKNRCEPVTGEPGVCWQDVDCPGGGKCAGAIICPCGMICDVPDKPGYCLKK